MDDTLPSLDWPFLLNLTNGKAELANEMLGMFLRDMPVAEKDINEAFEKRDYRLLEDAVHKFHGACCYCGVTKLQHIARDLENTAKIRHEQHCKELIQAMVREMEAVNKVVESGEYN